ncbi:NnrU family protein [Tropicimonas sp. IMCC34043]|uniref:NnrU family protein n=1 Tax=Tropicimonas sp. IMCC34043 TaxID=2248760 RepID=UPI000E282E27|nr:NnrU family protein [Tropicimonas sp. IMCC34043]
MYWILLVLGVALWWGLHLLKRLAPDLRAQLGDKAGPAAIAIGLFAAIVLMIVGFRGTPVVQVWTPPVFFTHINNLMMLIAIFMFSPAPKRGRLLSGMRHPMLWGFSLWAAAHLLVNGDLASILMFGGLLGWAQVARVLVNRAEPVWTPRTPGSWSKDGIFLLASAVLLVLIGLIHSWLGYYPFG